MSGAGIVLVTAIVVAALLCLYFVWRQRRNRTKRLIGDLLKEYFEGRMAVEHVGQRGREVTSRRFLGGPEFFALAHAAFQHAADAKHINVVGYLGPLTIAVAGGSNSLGRRHSCMIQYNIVV